MRDMDVATADLFSGPLTDFVSRRDALAKALRASGDRAAAAAVKSLRKPSRLAWALNLGVRNQSAFTALETALAGTMAAQASGADVRSAMAAQREAVRSFADAGAAAAEGMGQKIETRALANATLAVIGVPASFDLLRRGKLTDVPDAGGLDFLAGLPAPTVAAPVAEAAAPAVSERAERENAAARASARRAQEAFVAARARAAAAAEALHEAESELAAAEQRVRQANSDLAAALERRDAARHDAEKAAAELRNAETAHSHTQSA
jgi:hypothetical protein